MATSAGQQAQSRLGKPRARPTHTVSQLRRILDCQFAPAITSGSGQPETPPAANTSATEATNAAYDLGRATGPYEIAIP